jgi:hypothetical protein
MLFGNTVLKCGCSANKSKPAITMMVNLVKESNKGNTYSGKNSKENTWNKSTKNWRK